MPDLAERGYVLIASKPSLWLIAKGKNHSRWSQFWSQTIINSY